jgi:hypothetical protein
MNIAIFLTSTNDAIELLFGEPVVAGQYGEFMLFWRERGYREKDSHGYIPGGMLATRIFEIQSGNTFDTKAAGVMGPLIRLESFVWRGLPGFWRDTNDGIGPCISTLLQVTPQFAILLEYSLDVADSTPWAPFTEGSLLADVKQVSLVAPPSRNH